jgi:gliding motility-associated-like protein
MTHRIFLICICLLFAMGIGAQPSNDDCENYILVGSYGNGWCGDFSNIGATQSEISSEPLVQTPECWGSSDRDVWFLFQTTVDLHAVDIRVEGIGDTPIQVPEIAIYEGFCFYDEIFPLACARAGDGSQSAMLSADDLNPNSFLFIRVNDLAGAGDFRLCVEPYAPVINMQNGVTTACSGTLYDSGGPDLDYDLDEYYIFTVKPSSPSGCISVNIENLLVENSFDYLAIYDGEGTNGELLAYLTGASANLELLATSGAVTFEFSSDEVQNEAGFMITWQCSAMPCQKYYSITVDDAAGLQDLVDQFATPQVLVDSIVLNCPNSAYGTFAAINPSNLGIDKGVVLATGLAINAEGPNNDDGFDLGFDFFGAGDVQLDTLTGDTIKTQDACSLEMSVYVAGSELSFDYVFASEEYPEFAPPFDTEFNDVFGFFISGPGFDTPKNIAILPEPANMPTSINNVNAVTNSDFYRDNTNGSSIQYDGMTTVLKARTSVTPCNWYRLKLAIADRGDGIFDSGVFVANLQAGTPRFVTDFDVISDQPTVVEHCSTDSLSIILSGPALEDYTFQIDYEAMPAQEGVDVEDIPETIVFEAGQSVKKIPITVIGDDLDEGDESFKLTIYQDAGCGRIIMDSIVILIKDKLDVSPAQDTFFACNGQTSVQLAATGAAQFHWSPAELLNDPDIATPVAEITTDQWFFVEGSLGPCRDRDSTYVQFIDPMLNIIPDVSEISYCYSEQNTPIALEAANNTNGEGISWYSSSDGFLSNAPTISILPKKNTEYYAQLNLAGCSLSDTISIKVDDMPDLLLTANAPNAGLSATEGDSLNLCESQYVFLTSPTYSGYAEMDHTWLADGTPLNPLNNNLNLVVKPLKTTIYTRISTNGGCAETHSMKVVVNQDRLTALPENAATCAGSEVQLSVTGGTDYQWLPDDGTLSSTTIANPVANPDETTTYIVSSTVDGCVLRDSVTIEILDIPFSLNIVPTSPNINQGSVIQLFANATFASGETRPLAYQWSPSDGLDDPTIFNPNASPLQTTTYTVTATTEEGCTASASVTVTVLPPKDVEMPSIFTPNGDGHNDTFYPIYFGNTEIQLFQVYDRWGKLVFDERSGRWDGKFNDRDMPTDVYIYLVKIRYPNGREENLKGDVTLMR